MFFRFLVDDQPDGGRGFLHHPGVGSAGEAILSLVAESASPHSSLKYQTPTEFKLRYDSTNPGAISKL